MPYSTNWKVKEITLESQTYAGLQTVVLACQSVTFIEGQDREERSPDGGLMRSVAHSALHVEGLDSKRISFNPQKIYFQDSASGEPHTFSVHGMNPLSVQKTEFLLDH